MNSDADNQSKDVDSRKVRKYGGLFALAFIVFGMMLLSRHEPVVTVDCTPDIIANKPDIIMLGAWWCTYCYQAKRYFQKEKIHYCEYDMENTRKGKQLYEKLGGGAVPILLIGKYQLSGFSEQQIDAALATLK